MNARAASTDALALARRMLQPPRRRERSLPAVLAAALFAMAALGFAAAAILAPPLTITPAAKPGVR